MKKVLFSTLLIISLFRVFGQAVPGKHGLIGIVYRNINDVKPYKDYKEAEGVLIDPVGTVNYSLSLIINNKGNSIILFDQCLPDPASHKPLYKVLDTLAIGNARTVNMMVFAQCRINLQEDREIFALVKPANRPYFKSIIKAWRADRSKGKIIAVPVKGIDCLNETFGD